MFIFSRMSIGLGTLALVALSPGCKHTRGPRNAGAELASEQSAKGVSMPAPRGELEGQSYCQDVNFNLTCLNFRTIDKGVISETLADEDVPFQYTLSYANPADPVVKVYTASKAETRILVLKFGEGRQSLIDDQNKIWKRKVKKDILSNKTFCVNQQAECLTFGVDGGGRGKSPEGEWIFQYSINAEGTSVNVKGPEVLVGGADYAISADRRSLTRDGVTWVRQLSQ